MRWFTVEGGDVGDDPGPLRIVAESVAGLESGEYRSKEQLLATADGRRALEAWRANDDSLHEAATREDLAAATLDDELVQAGREARPDLNARFKAAMDSRPVNWAEAGRMLTALRTAGLEHRPEEAFS